jgi:SET domain-containing protein
MPGAGWGLFLNDRPAAAGDFLIEYGAEVVTSDESSRRGAIYDIFNRSYILALTKDADLDATALGNKARFINHSAKPNARAATVVAGGSRRVGLFATQTILSGEEITFNYGYGTKVEWQSDFRLSGRHRSSADVAKSSAAAAAEPAAASSDVAASASSSLPRWQPGKKQKL